MLRRMSVAACVAGVVAIALSAAAVQATVISVPDYSFQTADVSGSPYYQLFPAISPNGTPSYDAWGIESGGASAGVVLNGQYGRNITNMTGSQCGWMDTAEHWTFMDLSGAAYEVNKSYTLKVGLASTSGTYAPDRSLDVTLCYRTDGGSASAGATNVSYSSLSETLFSDCVVSIPAVQSTDAWANQPIVIVFHSLSSGSGNGTWNFDNVRLESTITPEPSASIMVLLSLISMMAYAWRKRR
jgi:hypothetical protein